MRAFLAIAQLALSLPSASSLSQRVAVVTGSSRGIGKGIAVELGRAGFAVYALSRSSRSASVPENESRALPSGVELTVEATAETVNAAGGRGIALPCDVSDDAELERALQAVVDAEGRLDVLVCSAYSMPKLPLRDDFWKQGLEMWDSVNGVGLRSVYAACSRAAPHMISTASAQLSASSAPAFDDERAPPPPLIVLVSSFGGKAYTFNVAYGVGKAAIDRLARDMAVQLGKHGVATAAIYPGLVQTEGNLEMVRRGTWDEASGGLDLVGENGETPTFSGRAVAALARLGGKQMLARSGGVEVVAELADEFGFTDVDGASPPSIRSLRYLLPNYVFPQIEREAGKPVPAWVRDNVPDVLLPWGVFSAGPPPDADADS